MKRFIVILFIVDILLFIMLFVFDKPKFSYPKIELVDYCPILE
jgi:hypothetical protein